MKWYTKGNKSTFGTELRSMFHCDDPDYNFIGIDADGLEGRVNAHYCYPFKGGKEHAYEMIDGDIHAKNAEIFGVTRGESKGGFYCLIYGGQEAKLAETLGIPLSKAKRLFTAFWNGNPALKGFRDYVEKVYNERGGKEKGYLVGLDGRRLSVRSPHAMVNLMFQSAGNILIIDMHDEWQALVHKDDIRRYIELAEKSIAAAAHYYKMNVPFTGTCIVGRSWGDTH